MTIHNGIFLTTAAAAALLAFAAGCDAPGMTRAASLSDAEIEARVRAELDEARPNEAHFIDVSSRDGVVTLRGPVRSEEASEELKQAAEAVDGVEEVRLHLEIVRTEAPDASGAATPPVGSPPSGAPPSMP